MKRLLLVIGSVFLSMCGCTTFSPVLTPARVEAVAALAGYGGAEALIAIHPEYRPAVMMAVEGLVKLQESEKWDALTAMSILRQYLPEMGLNSDEGGFILSGSVLFLDLIGGGSYDLKSQPYAKAFIDGLVRGLRLAVPSDSMKALASTTKPTDIYGILMREAQATRSRFGKR